MRSFVASTNPNLLGLFRALKLELEFSAMKNTQLLQGDNHNKKKTYQTADSKIKRPLRIFDYNADAERLITNLANIMKS